MAPCDDHHKVCEDILEVEKGSILRHNEVRLRLDGHGNDIRAQGRAILENVNVAEKTQKDVTEIKEALLGTLDKKGLVTEVRENTKHREKHDTTKNGLFDWAFRVGISLVLGFIAVKIGLK